MKSTSPSARAALIRTAFVIAQIGTAACLPALAQNAPPKSPATNAAPAVASTNSLAATAAISTNAPATTDGIQLSFQGANIDMIVQWLSQTTGKSVLKHPQAQCQLTIVGTKKVSPREAISLVYRALSLEGFTAIESGNSILIVPEGKEPKLGPELVDPARTDIPVGHQRLVKIFPLKMAAAADIRDKIKPLMSDKASLEINDRANQLIITDYTDGLNLASDLIKALDTDQPGDRIVRVIPLKHVSAQELVKEIGPLYQKIGGKNAGDSAEVSANERSNSLIVLSSEVNYRAIEKVVRILDTDDAQEKSMRAFPLKNADAEDVAKQIKELLQNQDNSNRFPFYNFSSSESSGRGGKKASVVADRRRNTVIVQAPPAELVGLGKMIEALDEPVEGESLAPYIFSLKYISAVDVEDVLNELFLKKQQQRQYYFFDEQQPEADRNVGRLYGKVRITSEPYSNTMIVTSNSKESLAAVVDVLKRLDVPSQAGESTLRVVLKFAKASTVANSLNVLFAKGGSPPLRPGNTNPQQNPNQQNQQQNQGGPSSDNSFQLEQENEDEGYFPWLGGQPENTRGADGRASARQVSDLVGRVRAVPDLRSNSLLLSANVHLLPQLIKLIDDLDAPTPQVLIEARIVEVSSDFLDKLGVRWSPDGKKVFTADDYDNSLVAGTTTKYAKGFGGPTAINSGGGASIAAAITSLRSGVIDSSVSIDFLIQFLRKNVNATVLAEPQINVRDNETAKLFVGSQVPFLKDSQSTPTGSLNQSFSYKDVGVILEVVPHVNKDGDVSLKIRTESSTVAPTQSIAGGVTLDTRNFKTFVTARSGETLVIGGIIQKQMSDTVRKVPVLGSIPGLGWAFKKKDKSIQEVELLVFLKTTVVTNTKEARAMTDEVDRRMPLIQKMNEDEARKTGTNSGKKTIPPAKTKP